MTLQEVLRLKSLDWQQFNYLTAFICAFGFIPSISQADYIWNRFPFIAAGTSGGTTLNLMATYYYKQVTWSHSYTNLVYLYQNIHLGKGNLILCCTGSQDNYFRSVVWQNSNNNHKFLGQQIWKKFSLSSLETWAMSAQAT